MTLDCCHCLRRNVMEVLKSLRWIFLLIVLTDSVIGHVSDGTSPGILGGDGGTGPGPGGLPSTSSSSSSSSASSTLPSTTSSLSMSPVEARDAPYISLNTKMSSNSTSTSISKKSSNGSNLTEDEIAEQQKILDLRRKGLPWIDKSASPNVTALLGKSAMLSCRIGQLGNFQVSWIRHRDIHLLTVGRYTYTTDQRFRSVQQPSTDDYSLMIKYPQHRDSGIYECQVSTTPHISHYIHLNVVEPVTEIAGDPDHYIDRGSTINLTCTVKFSPEPPHYIIWNHNNAIISYNSPRGGVSVLTEKGETTTSYLLIQQAKPTDSGRYSCNPSNAAAHSINVHVLNGELPAAMQTGGQMPQQIPLSFCLLSTAILLMI